MNAGRELDALVAEKVMGWHRQPFKPPIPGMPFEAEWFDANGVRTGRFADGGGGDYYHPDEEWEPSIRIDHAWEVAEKLRGDSYTLELYSPGALVDDEQGVRASGGWWAGLTSWERIGQLPSGTARRCATAPLAICLAALDAVGAEVPA